MTQKRNMIVTTITLTKEQTAWIKEKTINLSRFIQKKINEAMENEQMGTIKKA